MTATEPMIWTVSQFKKQSSPFNPAKRGRDTILQQVDDALEDFDEYRHTQLLNDKRSRAYLVVQACRAWIALKAGKASTTANMRRIAVSELGKQCWEYLQYWQFQQRKAVGAHGQLKPMGPGYTPERTLFVQGGKTQNPISGSYMHEATADPRGAALLNGKTFAQLTHQDYTALDNLILGQVVDPTDPTGNSLFQVRRRVVFLKKQDRVKHLLMISNGKLHDSFNSTFNTFAPRAYVIDEYGNLYSTEATFGTTDNFNHSTFNAGKDVICAGLISVNDGILTSINNSSGHYKPTRQNLHNAVTLLDGEGVDFTHCVITVSEPDPGRPGKLIEHDYNNAQAFINNINAAPTASHPQP